MSLAANALAHCPPVGERLSRVGTLARVIDNDSFELESSGRRSYIAYVGSATRLRVGTKRLPYRELKQGVELSVKGTVAAGPEEQCSIGAHEIMVRP